MNKTVAFVDLPENMEPILAAGRKIADLRDTQLEIIRILSPEQVASEEDLNALCRACDIYGASMKVVFSEDPTEAMIALLQPANRAHVITGMPHSSRSLLYTVWNKVHGKEFFAVDTDDTLFIAPVLPRKASMAWPVHPEKTNRPSSRLILADGV